MTTQVEDFEFKGFPARLQELIGEGSVSRFANEVGLGDNLVRKYLEGATPGLDKVVRICAAKQINIEWLATGRGDRDLSEGAPIPLSRVRRRRSDGETQEAVGEGRELLESESGEFYVRLPRSNIRVSAGGGSVIHSEQIVDYIAFNRSWYDREIGLPPSQVILFEVHGDSMVPDLHDGELAVVHTAINSIVSDGIYVLLHGESLLVKKINLRMDGRVEIKSSNETYGVEELTPEQAEQLIVIGRAKRSIPPIRRLP